MDEKLNLNKIIDAADLDADLKICLKRTVNELFDYRKKILDKIKSEVETDLKRTHGQVAFKIATAIVPRNEIPAFEERNFFIVKEDGQSAESTSVYFDGVPYLDNVAEKNFVVPNFGPYFLRCPYEELEKIFAARYKGHSAAGNFSYELRPNKRFIAQENKIFRLAELYNVKTPIIFSPYARRAVDICILENHDVDFATIDFEFEKNFRGQLLENYVLMWNIKFSARRPIEAFIPPDDTIKYFSYGFVNGIDRKTFIMPEIAAGIDIEIIRPSDERIDILTMHELPAKEFDVIKIFDFKDEKLPAEIFMAHFDGGRIFEKVRLRTAGDVNHVLTALSHENFQCNFGGWRDEVKSFPLYDSTREYFTTPEENFVAIRKKLPYCVVKVQAPKIYLTDYADFVIHFLTRTFPEFRFAAEVTGI